MITEKEYENIARAYGWVTAQELIDSDLAKALDVLDPEGLISILEDLAGGALNFFNGDEREFSHRKSWKGLALDYGYPTNQ